MTNDKFFIAEKMKDFFKGINDEKMDVLYGGRTGGPSGFVYDTTNPAVLLPDNVSGDTAVFSVLRNDSVSYEIHQDSMKSQDFHPVLGVLTIANAPLDPVSHAVPAGNFSYTSTLTLTQIYGATFDKNSPPLSVTVQNNGTGAISNFSITVPGVGSSGSVSIPGKSQGQLSIPVGGKTIGGSIQVTYTGSAMSAGSVSMNFDCNGLTATYLKIDDHLFSYQKEITNDYILTDTMNVDYVDILSGSFVYTFHNFTSVPLQINVSQLHLWEKAFSIQHNWWKVADVKNAVGLTASDTQSYYSGRLTNGYLPVAAGNTWASNLKTPLADCRLFPFWSIDSQKSVSRVVYTIQNTEPVGKILTIHAVDSMLFRVGAPNFKFIEMAGTAMKSYVRKGDTSRVSVPFPWNEKSKDSLRGKFILEKVMGDIFLTPHMPDSQALTPRRATIDTIGVQYSVYSPQFPQDVVSGSATLYNAVNGKRFRLAPVDLTKIINHFPDSLYIAVGVTVPVGTHMRAINDLTDPNDPLYRMYMGRMMLKATNDVRMNAVFNWKVDSSCTLDLGTGTFKMPRATRYITKMDSLHADLGIQASNHSNVNLVLYGLAAPKANMLALDSLPLNTLWNYINDPALAQTNGFVNLFGPQGVSIPPRHDSTVENVHLNEWQLKTLLGSDSASWRWEARFRKQDQDALRDTDFININSTLTIMGNNNMDSLLIWK